MNRIVLGVALIAGTATPALADHPAVANQGGRLAEAHGHRLELVTRGATLEVLLKDGHNQPMPAAGYSGKAVVMAPGGKTDVALAAEGDKLVGRMPAGAELAAAIVALKASDSHAMSARFPVLRPVQPPDAALAAKGRAVYEANCAACHGDKLQGQDGWQAQPATGGAKLAPALDVTGHGWHHTDDQLAQTIRDGAEPMPAFAEVLKEAEIEAVIAYFKSSWPAATLAQQPKSTGGTAAFNPASAGASGHHAGH